ncbi:MAG: putative basic amino acid antiporter YfcC [Fidelibacterota bacterium]
MKKFQAPDTYVIIFFVVLIAFGLSWIIPQGKFETRTIKYEYKDKVTEKTVLDPNSFTYAEKENRIDGTPLFGEGGEPGFLNYVFDGLVSGDKWGAAVGVIAFILVIGGAFGIIIRTGAIETGINAMILKTKGNDILLLPVMFLLFSLGGAVFGMGEEAIAFSMVLIPMVIALGYDSITGIMITFVATQIGFATSWMNPFGVAIAQGIAEVPVMSGSFFRIVMWLIFTGIGMAYTIIYARTIKRNPQSSLSWKSDEYFRNDFKRPELQDHKMTIADKLILLTILISILWIIYGVMFRGYYIPEIASQFFVMGLVSGIIAVIFRLNDMKVNDIAAGFRQGAKDLLGAALIVGMAKGIVIILGGDDPATPSVLNTILYKIGRTVAIFPAVVSAWMMFVFQSVFNFFIVSGSGQAALTMPLMAPLADMAGVSRQVAVLAFQLGDGFTNLIVPTSAALMGCLGVARLDWVNWAKFQIKFQVVLFSLGSMFVIAAVMLGFN